MLNIRNFSIIAHIDHGKSTLADRLLEYTGAVNKREMVEQILDQMDLERERGITIKAQTVRLNYKSDAGEDYIFNLIDTPGHVDFSYEVSRSLAACEGVLLVIDATQGIEAQTIANFYLALAHNLTMIPVINKIDLPASDVDMVKKQIKDILDLDPEIAIPASAKKGVGIKEILEAIVKHIPPPQNEPDKPLRSLLFDSWYNTYQGAVILTRVFEGTLRKGDKIKMMSNGKISEVTELGVFSPKPTPVEKLTCGEVGFVIAGIKQVKDTRIGDTITLANNPAQAPLPGYKDAKPMVFSGLYPIDSAQYEALRSALEKLHLNDSSFNFEPETSLALGFGFRCGFLGLLHMEIIKERLEREFNLSLITTAPTVIYKAYKTDGEMVLVDNPAKLPAPTLLDHIDEPYVKATIITPEEFVGPILKLVEEKRGVQKGIEYLNMKRVLITYELPFNEIVLDFYDRLKSISKGYASLDYEITEYRQAHLIKLDILLNGELVDALSMIIHREKAHTYGRNLAEKMKKIIPRQMYEVAIQASIGGKVVARETVSALRKNVLAKCYGGDITRKRKLLEKQKEGKKRMKQFGKIELPQEAFLAVLKN